MVLDAEGAEALSADADLPRIEAAVREILLAVGEDPERDGLVETPARVATSSASSRAGSARSGASLTRTGVPAAARTTSVSSSRNGPASCRERSPGVLGLDTLTAT